MSILQIYEELEAIALADFADVIVSSQVMTLPTGDPLKLRLDVVDGSFLDWMFLDVLHPHKEAH